MNLFNNLGVICDIIYDAYISDLQPNINQFQQV